MSLIGKYELCCSEIWAVLGVSKFRGLFCAQALLGLRSVCSSWNFMWIETVRTPKRWLYFYRSRISSKHCSSGSKSVLCHSSFVLQLFLKPSCLNCSIMTASKFLSRIIPPGVEWFANLCNDYSVHLLTLVPWKPEGALSFANHSTPGGITHLGGVRWMLMIRRHKITLCTNMEVQRKIILVHIVIHVAWISLWGTWAGLCVRQAKKSTSNNNGNPATPWHREQTGWEWAFKKNSCST
jgi:hypothetical protein